MAVEAKTIITPEQTPHLNICLSTFNDDRVKWLHNVVQREFGLIPFPLDQLLAQCNRAWVQINRQTQHDGRYVSPVDTDLLPLLKRSILYYRRKRVGEIEQLKAKTADLRLFELFDKQITDTDMFQAVEWFRSTTPIRMPRLTDYMILKRAEELLTKGIFGQAQPQRPQTIFDSKFGVLSPSLAIAPELAYWRGQCDLREVGLALAYFDIDNFKVEFNSHTETRVDRNCLPVIMRAIESHTFHHGSAYHEGGDEFIILLPNANKDYAIEFMDQLRLKMPMLHFIDVPAVARISIGMCHVGPDCPLTDAEVRLKANEAKKHAKTKGGKDCIVTYRGDKYGDE